MLFKKSLLAVAAFAFVGVASAATATNTFNVKMTVASICAIKTAPVDINLGPVFAGDAVVAGSTNIVVNCSKGTTYNVGLTPFSGSTAGLGSMIGPAPSTPIPYQLHQTTATGSIWGNVVSTNTMSGTGLGMGNVPAQQTTFTAFATVAAGATDAVTLGAYTEQVTVTVTY